MTFVQNKGYADRNLVLPCGQCSGCRLEHSRQWAVRCYHEASLHEHNAFITLTFNDENLPPDYSLSVRTHQLFMKRLRKKYGAGVRFYLCGEYGPKTLRPHYHACLFGMDFSDKYAWSVSSGKRGDLLYRSPGLEEVWPYGFASIGAVTFDSAAYVARYVMKKITGDQAADHYQVVNMSTGEIFRQQPEYVCMSRRPGIGAGWFEKFHSDVYTGDFVVINGKKVRPPRFYDSQYEVLDPNAFSALKRARISGSKKHAANNTRARLKVREKVQLAKLGQLKRQVD